MDNAERIWTHVDALRDDFVALADAVWATPELNFHEERSCAEHRHMLEDKGFTVTPHAGGLPTALIGEAGEGGPVIAFLGEYDALPALSQEANIAEERPIEAGGNGHGCGHNLLGSAALLAATALKDYLAANNIPGRVRYYGCPAEEGGAGKVFMVRAGLFDDVDVAITWHPMSIAAVFPARSLANTAIDFTFSGRSAHAAAAPHLGRSAQDAAELMNVGVNYMREHMPSSARIHSAYQDTGGKAPNVIPNHCVIRFIIRAETSSEVKPLVERVRKIADGAALMTETTVKTRVISAMADLLGNAALEETMQANLDRLGPPPFDADDRAFASAIQKTLSPQDLETVRRMLRLPPGVTKELCDFIVPLGAWPRDGMAGSTDVGDVSWAVPTVQALGATCALGTALHSWQMVAQGKSGIAHKGMVHVAKAMAGTAVDLLADPALLARAKQEHADRLKATPYVALLPEDAEPAFEMSA